MRNLHNLIPPRQNNKFDTPPKKTEELISSQKSTKVNLRLRVREDIRFQLNISSQFHRVKLVASSKHHAISDYNPVKITYFTPH